MMDTTKRKFEPGQGWIMRGGAIGVILEVTEAGKLWVSYGESISVFTADGRYWYHDQESEFDLITQYGATEAMRDAGPVSSTGFRCGTCCAPAGQPCAPGCTDAGLIAAARLSIKMLEALDPRKVPLAVASVIGMLRCGLEAPPVPQAATPAPDGQNERGNWTTKQWYEHVGAWETPEGYISFGSPMAVRAMLIQFGRAMHPTRQATPAAPAQQTPPSAPIAAAMRATERVHAMHKGVVSVLAAIRDEAVAQATPAAPATTTSAGGEACKTCNGTGYFYEHDSEVGQVARECEGWDYRAPAPSREAAPDGGQV